MSLNILVLRIPSESQCELRIPASMFNERESCELVTFYSGRTSLPVHVLFLSSFTLSVSSFYQISYPFFLLTGITRFVSGFLSFFELFLTLVADYDTSAGRNLVGLNLGLFRF